MLKVKKSTVYFTRSNGLKMFTVYMVTELGTFRCQFSGDKIKKSFFPESVQIEGDSQLEHFDGVKDVTVERFRQFNPEIF